MPPANSEHEQEVTLPIEEGLRFIGVTTSGASDPHLIRESYENADGRLLILYRHDVMASTADDGDVNRDV